MSETDLCLLARGIAEFTKRLHTALMKFNANEIFAPISIHAFLVLLSQDPWLHTKDISSVLPVDVRTAIDRYKEIFAAFSTLDDLFVTNTCFLKHHAMLRDGFKNHLKDNFFSNINFLDFAQLEGANEIINSYVRNKTAQKITHFDDIREGTNLCFFNAMHFQNDWADPFASEDTVPGIFHLNLQDKITVQMMRKKGEFYCKRDCSLGAEILKLPFGNSHISFVVFLFDDPTNMNQINLSDLTQLTKDMTKKKLDVSLPKFKMNETSQLVDPITRLRLNLAAADLCDIIDGEILNLSKMEQKVYLEVNESGSEMASGTLSTLTNPSEKMPPKEGLIIYEANISTEISNRFAKTNIVWRVNNNNTIPAKAEFKVVITETAFISAFEMEIEGKNYKSYIKEKEQAKNIYNQAVALGQSAGLVETKTRDSTNFVVSVNLEAGSVAVFSLTYEEMLQRIHDQYELVLNICPGQIVEDLNVEVRINESRPLKFVKTPPLRSGNDIRTNAEFDRYLDPHSDIKIINSKTATVKFRPDSATQNKMAHYLRQEADKGLSGQFVVQYDVERDPSNGEVLLQDGYFVHFFAPNDLDQLPKHIIFVLDTSGSMAGRKIEQLKDAMKNVLSDLRKEDMFHIMEFNCHVIVWDINSKKYSVLTNFTIKDFNKPFPFIQHHILPDPQYVDDTVINKAKEAVDEMTASGNTFAIGGLETALYLANEAQKLNENKEEKVYPIVVFLTDGEPNVGVNSKNVIVDMVSKLNIDTKVPIFSLSFGDQADRNFLRRLSLTNFGFSRHIYEAADASLQLQDFYKRISSPLLRDINFKYDAEVTEVTRTWFPIYFRGSELVVSGRYGGPTFPTVINCWGPHGLISVNSTSEKPVTSLERLWAYLTVKQLLDARETAQNAADLTRKAVDIALKYSFVTDVTSLVVVKPKEVIPSTKQMEAGRNLIGMNARPFSGCGNSETLLVAPHVMQQDPVNQTMLQGRRFKSIGRNFGAPQQSFGNLQNSAGHIVASPSSFGSPQSTAGFSGLSQQGFGSSQGTSLFGTSQQGFGSSQGLFGTPQQGFGNSQGTAISSGPSQQGFRSSQGATGLFGTSQQGFGSSQGTAGLFGTSGFGSSQSTTEVFGTSQQGFGSSQGTAGLFGTSGFGSSQSTTDVFGTPQQGFGSSQGTTGLFGTSQQGFGSSQGNTGVFGNSSSNTGVFGNSSSNTGVFGNSSTPSFSFGCPPTSPTSLAAQEKKSKLELEEENTFTANRPFMVMLQLEKDDVTLILLQGYVYRPC